MKCDVAIIGGGPGGSTIGSYLKIHRPDLHVSIFEREKFPRDHIGESQLPIISHYLHEMGVWDKVEAANFPIKIGGTYKWGITKELWDFDFVNVAKYQDVPRPGKFEGDRQFTAFQVDRAVYDKILLDHSTELGCDVYMETKVSKVHRDGDRVTGLELGDGEMVEAKYYIDATGHVGLLRRAMEVEIDCPTALQNVAVWDYWQNTDWAEEIGVGGTRIQILSVGYGWLWFIPLGPTRTSVGLVVPAKYFKASGKKLDELLAQALKEEPRVARLMTNAVAEGKLTTTKDWSFIAKRLYGENWFLVGESGGFADPILSAGLSITHGAAREAAFTILELERGKLDPRWLKDEFEKLQVNRITNHMRFADFWYSANVQFKELKEFTAEIAEMNGLDLSPDKAWAWLAAGGFIDDDLTAGTATLSLSAIRGLGGHLTPMDIDRPLHTNNVFTLNLKGAEFKYRARYENGGVTKYQAYVRDGKLLPLIGVFQVIVDILQRDTALAGIFRQLNALAKAHQGDEVFKTYVLDRVTVSMESMIAGGWVIPSLDPKIPVPTPKSGFQVIHWHEERNPALQEMSIRPIAAE